MHYCSNQSQMFKSNKRTLSSRAKQARSCLNVDFAICVSKHSKIYISYIVSYSVVKTVLENFDNFNKIRITFKV